MVAAQSTASHLLVHTVYVQLAIQFVARFMALLVNHVA